MTPSSSSSGLVVSLQLLTRAISTPLDLSSVRNGTVSSNRRTCSRASSASMRSRSLTKSGLGSIPQRSRVRAKELATVSFPRSRSVRVMSHSARKVAASTPAYAVSAVSRSSKSGFRIVSHTSMRHALAIASGLTSALPELGAEPAELLVGEAVAGQPPWQAAVPHVQLLEECPHGLGARQVRLHGPAADV